MTVDDAQGFAAQLWARACAADPSLPKWGDLSAAERQSVVGGVVGLLAEIAARDKMDSKKGLRTTAVLFTFA